jgi:metallo-beta-lactamase family protein
MLADSAFIQEKDAEFVNKRVRRRRALLSGGAETGDASAEPLYTVEDAERTVPLFRPILPRQPKEILSGLTLETREAGHMLGSNSVWLTDGRIRLGFSGDVGRNGLPIIHDPEPPAAADYLILESTYGDRLHKAVEDVKQRLAAAITRVANRGGKIVAPSFAVGRAQQVVLLIHQLIHEGRIPRIPIFVDSPLAVNATEVFRRHMYLYDEETREFLDRGEDPFGFSRLTYVREAERSKALNDLKGPFLVISASGMCEAGRVLHHLRNTITDQRNMVLITGYQAENTLGRKIVERLPEVPIFGDLYPLRAEVEVLGELSGHADQNELVSWLRPIAADLRRVFLVHGEPPAQEALKRRIEAEFGVAVTIPGRGESFELPSVV